MAGGNSGHDTSATEMAITLVHHVTPPLQPAFEQVRIAQHVTYIGRTERNHVVVPSDNVSRRHAKLIATEAGLTVHDLDSHNGIFVNGRKVRSATLEAGDLLYVADVCVQVRMESGPVSASAPALVPSEPLSAEDDHGERNLAALVRATELVTTCPAGWIDSMAELLRELTEADVVAWLHQGADGTFDAVALARAPGRSAELPVASALVQRALEGGEPLVCVDVQAQPAGAEEEARAQGIGAYAALPVLGAAAGRRAFYLARAGTSTVFTEREIETAAAVARLVGLGERTLTPDLSAESHDAGEDAAAVAAVEASLRAERTRQEEALASEQRARAEAESQARAANEELEARDATVQESRARIAALQTEMLRLRDELEHERKIASQARLQAEQSLAYVARLEEGRAASDDGTRLLQEGLFRPQQGLERTQEAAARQQAEGASLVQTTHATDERLRLSVAEVQRLEDVLRRRDDEIRELQEKARQPPAAAEVAHLSAELQRTSTLLEIARAELREQTVALSAAESSAAERESLRSAMRSIVPTPVVEHVEAVSAGAAVGSGISVRPVTALFISLCRFDAWAASAPAGEVKERLDELCGAVALRARANGGRVEQVLGHALLVLFPADLASVRAATRCAVEIASMVPVRGDVALVAAIHTATLASGFFGDGESALFAEVGEAVMVTRGITAVLAHDPAIYITDPVCKAIADDPTLTLLLVGQVSLLGTSPLVLHKVQARETP